MTRAAHPRRTVARSLVREQSRKLIAALEREHARERIELGGARAFAVGGGGEGAPGHQTRQITKLGSPQTPASAGVSDAVPWPLINVTYRWLESSSPAYTSDGVFVALSFRKTSVRGIGWR